MWLELDSIFAVRHSGYESVTNYMQTEVVREGRVKYQLRLICRVSKCQLMCCMLKYLDVASCIVELIHQRQEKILIL